MKHKEDDSDSDCEEQQTCLTMDVRAKRPPPPFKCYVTGERFLCNHDPDEKDIIFQNMVPVMPYTCKNPTDDFVAAEVYPGCSACVCTSWCNVFHATLLTGGK